MLLVKDATEGHDFDSHYLLHAILDYPHKNLFFTHVTFKGHAGLSPASIKFTFELYGKKKTFK